MTRIIDIADLAHGETSYEFEGYHYGDTNVSFILVDAPPGGGPRLYRHPYEEVFVVQEGSAAFTAGDDVIEATGGQVVVVPAGVAHKFVNSGAGRLRQVDIHTPATISLPSGSNDRGGGGPAGPPPPPPPPPGGAMGGQKTPP